ncbi:MAG TPA: cyclic pyranopterin monophosphate synthase MoaC [Phycisphaerae bacterium]|nr:cyclic pyranopterin monophosphate synthase MoaC [Phycisphaerae bacterium]
MEKNLSHLTPTGAAAMVDVSQKSPSTRRALAEGFLLMAPATLQALRTNSGPKGEALSVARIAGILAAKKTADLIPLCHPLPLDHVTVDFDLDPPTPNSLFTTHYSQFAPVRIRASAAITAKTGIEMEALTAVALAALTLIDMLKAIDPAMIITHIRLLEKTGGKSDYHAADAY